MNIIIYTLAILSIFYLLLRFVSNISSKKISKGLRFLIIIGLIVLAVIVGGYFLYTYSKSKAGSLDSYAEMNQAAGTVANNYEPSKPLGQNGGHGAAGGMNTNMHGLPPSCAKQQVVDPAELLPKDSNSEFSKLNPMGSGDLKNVSLLKAGWHIGINTVGY